MDSISAIVRDPSGAVVRGAKVVLKDEGKGVPACAEASVLSGCGETFPPVGAVAHGGRAGDLFRGWEYSADDHPPEEKTRLGL